MDFQAMGASVARLLRQNPGTNGLYTCADLSAVINDANLDVTKDTQALQNTYTVYTVAGTWQYALSATNTIDGHDLLSVWKVMYNRSPLNRVGFNTWQWSANETKESGTPRVYRIWNNKLEIDPTPDAAYPIDMYYIYKPSTLAMSSAISELPSEYHMAVIYRACAYLTVKDEKEMRYNAFFAKYQYELQKLKGLQAGNDTEAIDMAF